MQLASQLYQIKTAYNGVCFSAEGEMAYITKRFDIIGGQFCIKDDCASILNRDDKYNGNYEEIAAIIHKYSCNVLNDITQLFRLILFNFLFCNGDAHLMNFSFLEMPNGHKFLSPAYDLLNTRLHKSTPIFALDNDLIEDLERIYYNENGIATYRTFMEFSKRIKLQHTNARDIVDQYCSEEDKVKEFINNSFFIFNRQTAIL